MSDAKFKSIVKRLANLAGEPYAMGWDAAVNGSNNQNCHCTLFSTPEKRQKWEEGKAAGERFVQSRSV